MRLLVKELRELIGEASQGRDFEDVFDEIVLFVNELEDVDVSEPSGRTTDPWRNVVMKLKTGATVRDLSDVYDSVFEACKRIVFTVTGEKPALSFDRVSLSAQEQLTTSSVCTQNVVVIIRAHVQLMTDLLSVGILVKQRSHRSVFEAARKKTSRKKKNDDAELLCIELFEHFVQTYGADSVAHMPTIFDSKALQVLVKLPEGGYGTDAGFKFHVGFSEDVAGVMHMVTGERPKTQMRTSPFNVLTSQLVVTIDAGKRGFTRKSGHVLPRNTEPDEAIFYVVVRVRG